MADTFNGVIAFAFLVSMILLGTVLRARFRFIQSALVPASLLGGLIGFVLVSLDLSFGFKSEDFVAFAFHFFTLSFMSLVLTSSGQKAGTVDRLDHEPCAPGIGWLNSAGRVERRHRW